MSVSARLAAPPPLAHPGTVTHPNAMTCTCCQQWRIEPAVLDGVPRLKVSHRGYLVGVGYFTTVPQVVEALERYGGPGLAEFKPC